MSTVEELSILVTAKAEEIKTLKAGGATKESLTPYINELLELKEKYKVANGGVPFDPPKVEAPKKPKGPSETPPTPRDTLSKKELSKLARKEKRTGQNDESKVNTESAVPPPPTIVATASVPVIPNITVSPGNNGSLVITYSPAQVPELCRTVASILSADVSFSPSSAGYEHQAYLTGDISNGSISGDLNISKYFARKSTSALQFYGGGDPWLTSQIDQWLEYYAASRASLEFSSIYSLLNAHLELRTYIVGHSLSIADVALVLLLKRGGFVPNAAGAELSHLTRWFNLIAPTLPYPKSLASKPKPAVKANASLLVQEMPRNHLTLL